jgi:Uma2 family endonuclease
MVTTILLQNSVEIPFVQSLEEFRAWALSDEFPDHLRIDYLHGHIEVDMSPEDLYCHGTLKTRIVAVFANLVDAGDLGELFSDKTRISSPLADLSSEPDVVFVSYEAFETGRVSRVPKQSASGRFVELEGAPDVVVEIVSDSSETKDTQRLPGAYFDAGVLEFWLFDVRGTELDFRIYRRGPNGFELGLVESDGFRYSAVFRRWFRLSRRPGRAGGWQYDLHHQVERG